MEKKVSIIIPVYNAENYLERAVSSVLKQTYKNIELILVDDGSKDNSPALCDILAKKDDRIIVVHKENGGPSSARNKGIEVATGDYVEFVDADDYVEENCVETLVNNIDESDLVICGYYLRNNDVQEYKFEKKETLDFRKESVKFFDMVRKGLFNSPCNKLYKRELIKDGFDKRYFIGEDTIFNTKYIKNCKKVTLLPEMLYNYDFTNQASLIHTKVRTEEDYEVYWSELYAFAEDFFQDKSYLSILNGIYIKSTMSQVITVSIKQNLAFKEYKKVFSYYRNHPMLEKALKKHSKKVFVNRNFLGQIVVMLFKLKLKLLFYIVLKCYKKEKFKKQTN